MERSVQAGFSGAGFLALGSLCRTFGQRFSPVGFLVTCDGSRAGHAVNRVPAQGESGSRRFRLATVPGDLKMHSRGAGRLPVKYT